jgi:hypothetical protein
MNMTNDDDQNVTRVDRAMSARLSRLSGMPVDTSRVAARLRAELPPLPSSSQRQTFSWLRPLRAVAASFVVLALIGAILIGTASRPVLASAEQLAQVHNEMVAGHSSSRVDSMDAARRAIAAEWPDAPAMPDVPKEHVMACCMKPVNDRKTACVLLKQDDVPVTMMVADADDVRMPESPTVVYGGVPYHVSASGATNMVMTKRDGRWVCLMGSVSRNGLIEMASKLSLTE